MESPIFEEETNEIDLRRYIYLILTYKWAIVITTIAFALVIFIISSISPPIYRASTLLLIDTRLSTETQDVNNIRASESLAQTYTQMLVSRPVLEETLLTVDSDQLGLGKLRSIIEPRPVAGTQLLQVVVEHEDPELSANVANTVATVFIRQNQRLQSEVYANVKINLQQQIDDFEAEIVSLDDQIAELGLDADPIIRNQLDNSRARQQQNLAALLQNLNEIDLAEAESTSVVTHFEEAVVPILKVRPNELLNAIVGGLVGLVLAVSVIVGRDFFDDTIKRPDEISQQLKLRVIGQVGHFSADTTPLITFSHPRAPVSEGFRDLRMGIRYASVDKPFKTLLVTSPSPSEGKSTTAANLSAVIAQGGRKTILFDGDLRRPKVHTLFDSSNAEGVSGLFIEESLDTIDNIIQPTQVNNLSTVVSGPLPPNPSELLDTQKARDILDALVQRSDTVVIDAPPLVNLTDALALAQYVDGVIIVFRVGQTQMALAKKAVNRLRRVNANIIGAILVDIDDKASRFDYGYYDDRYFHYYEVVPQAPSSNGQRKLFNFKRAKNTENK